MWITIGRLLMLLVWGILIFNFISPFPKPLRYFMDVAAIFTFFMHALQILLLKSTLNNNQPLPIKQQVKILIFGVFELLAWQKKQTSTK